LARSLSLWWALIILAFGTFFALATDFLEFLMVGGQAAHGFFFEFAGGAFAAAGLFLTVCGFDLLAERFLTAHGSGSF
jgi:hypothetical protein